MRVDDLRSSGRVVEGLGTLSVSERILGAPGRLGRAQRGHDTRPRSTGEAPGGLHMHLRGTPAPESFERAHLQLTSQVLRSQDANQLGTWDDRKRGYPFGIKRSA